MGGDSSPPLASRSRPSKQFARLSFRPGAGSLRYPLISFKVPWALI